jgi:hypothetical protein
MIVAACTVCQQAKARFTSNTTQLSPLPIEPLFYRWGVDLAGPFPTTTQGNKYIMVCIEHLSKWIEAVPIPDKTAATVAYAFNLHVLGRFGACAEVLTDQGTEFQGVFASLLQQAYIDHRTTSANHPQADGLAERAVQSVKLALRKRCLQRNSQEDWDLDLPWVMMGYRCSVQESTKLTPYEILYGLKPIVPPAVRERVDPPIDFSNLQLAAQSLLRRAAAVKEHAMIAAENLKVAQHRDTLRYALKRTGNYSPRLRQFSVGDLVYMKARPTNTLQMAARRHILRVKEVRESGVLVLQGKCGRTVSIHTSQCAPCHLPYVDTTINHELARPGPHHPCHGCKFADRANAMLLCDACGLAWHMFCLVPALTKVPEGVWVCPECVAQGVTAESVSMPNDEPALVATCAQPVLCMIACPAKPKPATEQELSLAMPQLLQCLNHSTLKGVVGLQRLPDDVRDSLAALHLPWQHDNVRPGQGTIRFMAPIDAPDLTQQLQGSHVDGILAVLAPAGWATAAPRATRNVVQLPAKAHLPAHRWILVFKDGFAKARYLRPGMVTT